MLKEKTMLKISRTYLNEDVDIQKEILNLFGFNIISTKPRKKVTTIKASIDNEQKNYHNKFALFKKVSKWNYIPFYPIFIFTLIAVALISVLLGLFIAYRGTNTAFYSLIALGLPACLFLLATVIYSYFKFKNDLHNINNTYTLFEIKALVDDFNKGGNDNANE